MPKNSTAVNAMPKNAVDNYSAKPKSQLAILLRKQFGEFVANLSRNRRTGKRRTGSGLVLYVVLLVFIGISLAASFTAMYLMLALPLVRGGQGHIFFTFTGVVTAMIGLIGGMFVTYGVLYCPKDNEALLAMPIPPRTILIARMLFVWIQILMYTATAALPAIALAQIFGGFNIGLLLLQLAMYLLLTLFLLAISCGLGWLLALIAAKAGKKAVTVVSIIVSLGAYLFFYIGRQRVTGLVMRDPADAGNFFKKWLWPFYAYGCGSAGRGLEAALFGALAIALIALAIWLLSRSFIALITTKKSRKAKKYVEKTARANSPYAALARLELRRFLTDPLYLVNSALGVIFVFVAGVVALIYAPTLRSVIAGVNGSPGFALLPRYNTYIIAIAVFGLCLVSSMSGISSAAVSLEGNRIWIPLTIPVSASRIMLAKLTPHLLFSGSAALFASLCACLAGGTDLFTTLLAPLTVLAFVALTGTFGLFLESRRPKLNWTDETVAIKNNLNVLFATLGSWLAINVTGGVAIPLCFFFPRSILITLPATLLLFAGLAYLFFRLAVNGWKKLEA
ncbi:MAG: hypothetical protein J6V14_03325 [Clostridia bacterium]|nr:hypothetical protein [Clostridia bacterium]